MSFSNREIIDSSDGAATVIFDLDDVSAQAAADACSHYRLQRFAYRELYCVDEVLDLRALDAVADQLAAPTGAQRVLHLPAVSVELLNTAMECYLRERESESYQTPAERERLATLHELAVPLMELVMDLRARADGQEIELVGSPA